MSEEESSDTNPLSILVAMGANAAVAVVKFIAAVATGSAAMFAEGVHSVVDTVNQGILLIGARRSLRPPDTEHPFGYGKDVYFWALVYSVLMFGLGGGVTIYKGIEALRNPEPVESYLWAIVILSVAIVTEAVSWLTAWRALNKKERGRGLWQKLGQAKDPSHFVILAEDGAAILGALVALVGLLLSMYLHSPYPDAIASIVIGFVLGLAAIGVTIRTHSLLVGQAAAPEVVDALHKILESEPGVRFTGPPLTMHLGPRDVLAGINIKFDRAMAAPDVARAVDRVESAIRARFPEFTRIFIEAQLQASDVEREQPPPPESEAEQEPGGSSEQVRPASVDPSTRGPHWTPA